MIELIAAVLAAASLSLIFVRPERGPTAWLRERLVSSLESWSARRGGNMPSRSEPAGPPGKTQDLMSAGVYLLRCPKCLSVWIAALVGPPCLFWPGLGEALLLVTGPYLLLWAVETVGGKR